MKRIIGKSRSEIERRNTFIFALLNELIGSLKKKKLYTVLIIPTWVSPILIKDLSKRRYKH